MTDATEHRMAKCYLVRLVVEGYHGKDGLCKICGQPSWLHADEFHPEIQGEDAVNATSHRVEGG